MYKQDSASFSQKKKLPCQVRDRHKQREVLKVPELQITLKETSGSFCWDTKVVLCLLPENWGLRLKTFTWSGERGKKNLKPEHYYHSYLWVFISLPHHPSLSCCTTAHEWTTVHREGVRTTNLITFSTAKLALVRVPWMSSKETLAPGSNSRCCRALSGSLLTGFAQDWTKKYMCLHAQREEYSVATPMTIYWK